jgi:uncharacterized membrane protein YedE/YeeE
MRSPLRLIWAVAGGLVFGFGLAWSGMARPEVVLGFLQLRDLGLLLVMASSLLVLALVFWLAPRLGPATLLGEPWSKEVKPFHRGLIPGAVIFGIGWGLTGVCPGAGLASLGLGNGPVLIAVAAMLVGAWLQGIQKER